MESDMSQAFEEEFICNICLNCLTDPVTISCGHSFCRSCLCLSWEDIQPPARCPVCREPSQQKELRTNLLLKKLVPIARQASLRKCLNCEENLCVTHKETKRVFCQEDRILLCQLCSNSQEHEGHRHCPVEAAVEEQREKLLKEMENLWEKIEENQRNLKEEQKIILAWMGYVSLHEVMIMTEYRKFHPALYEDEKQHMQSLSHENLSILEKLRENEDKMVQKRNQLRATYQELVAVCHGTYLELLQNGLQLTVILRPQLLGCSENEDEAVLVEAMAWADLKESHRTFTERPTGDGDLGEILTRSESVQLRMPQLVKPALSAKPITGLIDRSNDYQVEISFENVIMIHYKMSLFNDVRRFSFRHLQNRSVNSEVTYCVSWGAQIFSYGKYYWELGVTDSWDWAIGVCKESHLSRCGPLTELKNVFLLVFVREGDHYSLQTTCPSLFHYVEKPLGQVGIFLDCDLGSVSFLNVAKNSLIWRYPPGSFNFPVRPFFSTSFT